MPNLARERLVYRSLQIHGPASLCISHSLAERFWNPRIVILDHKLGDLRPLTRRQSLELLDQVRRAHGTNLVSGAESSNTTVFR